MLHFGIILCFLLNAVSYIPVIIGLFMIRVNAPVRQRIKRQILKEIGDGLKYIKANQTLIADILIFGIVSTFAMNNDVVVPVFAKNVLGQGADTYTYLLTAAGAGSLVAALLLASRSNLGLRKDFLIFGAIGTAIVQISTIFTANYALSLVLLAFIGFFNLVVFNTANGIFQLHCTNEYRGRVMSVYSLLNQGSTPVGNFFAGTVMEHVGGDSGFLACGGVTLALLIAVFVEKRRMIASWIKGPIAGTELSLEGSASKTSAQGTLVPWESRYAHAMCMAWAGVCFLITDA